MKLSKALENNIKSYNLCKTKEDIYKRTNWIINHNSIDDKDIARTLQKCLRESKSYEKSMMYISSFILTDERVCQKTKEKKNWFVGTAIHGMECSGH